MPLPLHGVVVGSGVGAHPPQVDAPLYSLSAVSLDIPLNILYNIHVSEYYNIKVVL